MKLCIDCKMFVPAKDDPRHLMARCGANFSTNPVSGEQTFRYAFEQRVYTSGICGTDAILFIPKTEEYLDV
jgi:hypothetical protein